MMIKETKEHNVRTYKVEQIPSLAANFLTLRYYSKYPGEVDLVRADRYMDRIMNGTSAGNKLGYTVDHVVWHAEERLPVELYQGYTIELKFSVKPVIDGSEKRVDYVDVTVFVKDGEEAVCQKERRIDLQNTVYFKTAPTMYSD